MHHGRSHARVLTLLAIACIRAEVFAQDDAPAKKILLPALALEWQKPDHLSGIYHVKADAKLTVTAENASNAPVELSGEILFGTRSAGGEFKTVSVTPMTTASLAAGQRATIPLSVTFAAAGTYELRWKHGADVTPIAGANGVSLQCIFAPRRALAATAPAVRDDSRWITELPRAAVHVPGLLSDYIEQTYVNRFVIDERFSFDAPTGVGLGFGASTHGSASEVDALLAEAARAHAHLVLRLTVPAHVDANESAKTIAAFKEYITDAVRRSRGALSAIAVVPDLRAGKAMDEGERAVFRDFYLAGYEAAKHADRNVLLLGAGSAAATGNALIAQDEKLLVYLDAMAIEDAAGEPIAARKISEKLPMFLLPPMGRAPRWPLAAAGLAAGAQFVPAPAPDVDNGVTAHLFGGTVFFQRVQLATPQPDAAGVPGVPFIGVFQGDGYSVAAIAGFAAGTDLDALCPSLAHGTSQVTGPKRDDAPDYPHLDVSDDTHSMRAVDSAGTALDCRVGDHLYVPVSEKIVYVLQGGMADDLAGTLRPSRAYNLPVLDIAASVGMGGELKLTLHNISQAEQAGQITIVRPSQKPGGEPDILATQTVGPIAAGKAVECTVPRSEAEFAENVVIQFVAAQGITQRTAIAIPDAAPAH